MPVSDGSWATLLQSLSAGTFALIAVGFGRWLEGRTKRNDDRRADGAVLRSKAEELFAELSGLGSQAHGALLSTMSSVTKTQLPRVEENLPLPTTDRLRALISVYFPQLLPLFTTHHAALRAIARQGLTDVKASIEQPTVADIQAARITMVAASNQQMAKMVEELSTALAKEIATHVPALRPASRWR